MSNPLGGGTANITYNGPVEESELLNRLAFSLDVSRGELLRIAVLRGIETIRSETAAQIKSIREERLRLKHGVACLAIGCFAIVSAWFADQPLFRARRDSPRQLAVRREECA